MNRLGPAAESALSTFAVIIVMGAILSAFSLVPATQVTDATGQPRTTTGPLSGSEAPSDDADPDDEATVTDRQQSPGPRASAANEPGDAASQPDGANPVAPNPDSGGFQCRSGANGGETDVGVTGEEILLAATVVDDGPGSSFLGPVRTAMLAKANQVNRDGGICGRQLKLILRNDSWDAQRGRDFIQRFVEQEKVFALAVVPSSEGLRAANDYIEREGVPVVGTDGMLIHQYLNPWIWPVATSTISTMHVMAKEASDRGAQNFGIVFDAKFRFGVEGAFAYNQAVKRLTGSDIPGFDPSLKTCELRFCGIQPNASSYTAEAQRFTRACYSDAPVCDFVAYLLEPDTAVSFIKSEARTANTVHGYGLAQPLFNRTFAEGCGRTCNGMRVWTGYRPPIEVFEQMPQMQEYIATVRQQSSTADVTNQFLEGAYVGMSLLVDALQAIGPDVTRARLAAQLDAMTFDSGLSSPLTWRAGDHFANQKAMAFEIQFSQSFNGWRQATDFIQDPWVGEDIPEGEG